MTIDRREFNAKLIITIVSFNSGKVFDENEVLEAAFLAENKINEIPIINLSNALETKEIAFRLHVFT